MRYTAIQIGHDDACRLLAAAQSPRTDAAGRFSLPDLVGRGRAYQISGDGEPVAAYLVEVAGDALWITAAAGRAPDDLVAVLSRFAVHQAFDRGLSAVAFRTERRGLVRKARRIGYQITRQDGNEYFLRKTLQC